MASTAAVPLPSSHPPPAPWKYVLSKSQGKYYYFNPDKKTTLWPLEVPESPLTRQWGWEMVKEGSRQYVNLTTGAVSKSWPPEVSEVGSGASTGEGAVGEHKRKGGEGEEGGAGEGPRAAKRTREEAGIPSSSSASGGGSGGGSAGAGGSEGGALRPPSNLVVSTAHLGVPHPDAPLGLSPIIPPTYLAALRELAEKAGGGVGLPAERPNNESFHHGWFFPPHKVVLSELLSPDTKLIVELGCWLGKSLFFMAERAPNAILVTIDLWDNTFIVNEQGDHYCNNERQVHILNTRPLYETFICNAWEKRHRVLPMKMTTERGVALLVEVLGKHGIAPDLVYVDADHHYGPARRDIEACVKAFPKAHIVGDDYDYEEVKKAAHDIAVDHKLKVHAEGGKCWTFSHIRGDYRAEYASGGGGIALPAAELEEFQRFSAAVAEELGVEGSGESATRLCALLERAFGGRPSEKSARWLGTPLAAKRAPCKDLTILQAAARLGRDACVTVLLSKWGCDVNVCIGKGKTTPLGQAAYFGHHTTAAILLKYSADVGIKNEYGETPLEAAKKERRVKVVEILTTSTTTA